MHFHQKPSELADIIYINKNNEITQRRIKIYGENRERIIAYCYLRKGIRSFTKEQILAQFPVQNRKLG